VPTHLRDASRDKEGFGHGEGYLYPHAYRDHWVAQQYLPDACRARSFTSRAIRATSGHPRPGGPPPRGPTGGHARAAAGRTPRGPHLYARRPDRDRWLQRTVSNAGERLGRLRDRVLDAAAVQRHHVVLDLNAGSGLLTWEACAARRRAAPGPWPARPAGGEALRQQAARLPEVERPVVLVGEPASCRTCWPCAARPICALMPSSAATTREPWFAAEHLGRLLSKDQVAPVEALFRRQLTGQAISWRSRLAFLTARRPLDQGR
jgi:hypothetical protein